MTIQTAATALLRAQSLEDLERLIVDVLPGAIGFERAALLSPPTDDEPARVLHYFENQALDLTSIPKNSPFAPSGCLDGQRSGCDDDKDLPLRDVRGSYVIAPLRDRSRSVALFYADSLREDVEAADAAAAVAYALDIAEIVRVNLSMAGELAALARTDSLTGLPNRRVFEERLEQELRRSARSRRPFALAIVDLDRFKQINDDYGQQVGDEVLRAFAMAIRRYARQADFVARFVDDKFAMLLVDADRGAAHTILERILHAVREVSVSGPFRLMASAGVALSFPVDTRESILERADAALYDAKHAGRDCARFA